MKKNSPKALSLFLAGFFTIVFTGFIFINSYANALVIHIFNIQGYILTLLEDGINDPQVNRLYLERTEKSINRMINIVEDPEGITKFESRELKLKTEENILKGIKSAV